MYIQDAIELKDSGDLRVMLIGHKPVCAFWRYSGKGEWITNTSQGGSMSYDNVPMNALELAVKTSKAAKAEYWACDIAIDAKTDQPYVLECATAFAAFPYIRDWIGQYIMWDLSEGRFRMPHVPLYSWEELGKIDASLLRTMRHIHFSDYTPSADGVYWLKDKDDTLEMELTEESQLSDVPESIAPIAPLADESELPDEVKLAAEENEESTPIVPVERFDFLSATLTQLLTLYGMDDETAVRIKELIDDDEVNSFEDLVEYDFIPKANINQWRKAFLD
jgi:hypothetical protein